MSAPLPIPPESETPKTPPALPKTAPTPLSAETAAAVARWNEQVETLLKFREPLAKLMDVFDKHPDFAAWIKGSEAGTFRMTP